VLSITHGAASVPMPSFQTASYSLTGKAAVVNRPTSRAKRKCMVLAKISKDDYQSCVIEFHVVVRRLPSVLSVVGSLPAGVPMCSLAPLSFFSTPARGHAGVWSLLLACRAISSQPGNTPIKHFQVLHPVTHRSIISDNKHKTGPSKQ